MVVIGTGSVALFATQIAAAQGARVVVISGSDEKLERAKALGAADGINRQRHPQWAGHLSPERQADLIAGARGLSGPNVDYLRDLVEHLREYGMSGRDMERLLAMVEAREAEGRHPDESREARA